MKNQRINVAALLLVVQCGLALLAALGLSAYARFANAIELLRGFEVLAFGAPIMLLLLSAGVVKGWRLARIGVYVWEVLTILGPAFSVLASAGSALTLTVGLTGFGLPAAVVFLTKTSESQDSLDLRDSLTAGLLVVTGLIHLALAPAHLNEPPKLGGLFALDGLAFITVAIAAARGTTWWRGPTIALLLATIVAYLLAVITGKESVDDLGVGTKVVELLALGLAIWPRDVRFSWRWLMATSSLVATIVFSGGVAWAATLRPGSADNQAHHNSHSGKVLIAEAPPSDQQRLAAVWLVDDTRAGIERFADLPVALADGYVPGSPAKAQTVHYLNPKYVHDGTVDPTRPQGLVYANTPSGPLLLGAMYMMPKANLRPPDIGGSLTKWHTHSNLCFLVPGFALAGFQSPFGTCPVGAINGPTPAMLHVWTVPNPAGPFADLTPAYLARLTRDLSFLSAAPVRRRRRRTSNG